MKKSNDSKYPINSNLLYYIKHYSRQSPELSHISKRYYGNYFVKNIDKIKGYDAFFHIAKHHTYVLNNPETDQEPYFAHPLTNGDMSLPLEYNKKYRY